MNGDSDDEFGDGDSFEYNEALETQLQLIESQLPNDHHARHVLESGAAQPTTDRAPATRRKLEHLDIVLEDDIADDEVVDNLVGEEDQVVLDVLNVPASQSSRYEEDLVQQVTNIMPGASQNAEPEDLDSQPAQIDSGGQGELAVAGDVEETGKRKKSLFEKFRKRGFFSVTDLVAPSWCEVQFDYRLRSKSYLPVAARPDTITTSSGAVISVNKEIAGTGEKIMRKGEQVHKKLEREIHPVEVQVKTESREDVWGLRFLNMLASLEALLTLGKCRELPVVGFIRGYMIVGVIDEITRQPLISYSKKKDLLSSAVPSSVEVPQKPLSPKKTTKGRGTDASPSPSSSASTAQAKSSPQKTLFAFYRPLRAKPTAPPKVTHERTHMIYVSDSKTRAGGTLPKEENSINGKMQLMLYKEMLDGMIVEGLRQHAREQGNKQQLGSNADDDIQIVEMNTDDDIVCLNPKDNSRDDISSKAFDGAHGTHQPEQPRNTISPGSPTTVDRFTWRELFEHLSLDPEQPFTKTFQEQSRLLVQGNNLSATVAGAETLQQMTSCWAEYVAKLGLGTIDPGQKEKEIEDALEMETGGRRIGRSEKLLTLVYRRVGKARKTKKGNRRQEVEGVGGTYKPKRGKRRKRGEDTSQTGQTALSDITASIAPPIDQRSLTPSADIEMENENERLLQLAIVESLVSPTTERAPQPHLREIVPDCTTAAEMDVEEEPLPASLVPPEVFQAAQQRLEQSLLLSKPDTSEDNVERKAEKSPTSDAIEKVTEDSEGSIIGSQRFAYSPALLSEHIDQILQFWTGSREPVGVSIENTTRCGWCEFEDGCEWRAAKSVEAANRNIGLQSSRRPNIRSPCP